MKVSTMFFVKVIFFDLPFIKKVLRVFASIQFLMKTNSRMFFVGLAIYAVVSFDGKENFVPY